MEPQQTIATTEAEAQTAIPDAPVLNPLAQLVSHFEDDPYWDVMMDSIRRHRLELDAAWDTVE